MNASPSSRPLIYPWTTSQLARTLPVWLKSTANSENPQIIWQFSGIEMGGTAREMGVFKRGKLGGKLPGSQFSMIF